MSLDALRERLQEIPQADERRLQELKTELLGRKAGALTEILKGLATLDPRPARPSARRRTLSSGSSRRRSTPASER